MEHSHHLNQAVTFYKKIQTHSKSLSNTLTTELNHAIVKQLSLFKTEYSLGIIIKTKETKKSDILPEVLTMVFSGLTEPFLMYQGR